MEQFNFPKCQKCKTGDLVPLSDFGCQEATYTIKVDIIRLMRSQLTREGSIYSRISLVELKKPF